MKNRFYYLLILGIFIGFITILQVNAATIFTVEVERSSEVLSINDTIKVTAHFGNVSSQIKFDMIYDSNVYSLVSITPESSWSYEQTGTTIIANQKFVSNTDNDVIIIFKVIGYSNNSDIKFTNISNNTNQTDNNIEISNNIKNVDNYLKSLIISEGELTPAFSQDVTTYKLNIYSTVKSINVQATPNDYTSQISGIGTIDIQNKDKFTIIVTSEAGTTREYLINLNKKEPTVSTNTYLASLVPSVGSINFNKTITEYTLNVPYTANKINFDIKTEDNTSTYKYVGASSLVAGNNVAYIIVTAADGSTRKYTINIIRENITNNNINEKYSNDNYLKSLIIEGYKLKFDKDINEYDLLVENYNNLIINTETSSLKANVNIQGNTNLKEGSKVSIIVTAEDGTNRIYNINIYTDSEFIKKEPTNILLYILLVLLIVIFIILIIFRKRKNKKFDAIELISNSQ